MIVEDRFARPIITDEDRTKQENEVASDPEQLTDVSQFAEESDTKRIAHDNAALSNIDRTLEEEFAAIEREHQEAHGVL